MFVDLNRPWRHAKVTDQRTCIDFAECMRDLVGIRSRLDVHFTPKHASWLTMLELEIGEMVRQCLNRRIAETSTLISEISRCERRRNREGAGLDWMFTIDRARETARRTYPPPAGHPQARALRLVA